MKTMKGFSIVELMIGLVISMVVSLAVFQTFALFEAQKRTTTSGSDAQINGLVALQSLERDLKMAGDGLANDWLQSCTSLFHYYNPAAAAAASPIPNFSLAAVSLVEGASGAADTIMVRRGNSIRSNGPIALDSDMLALSTPLQVTNLVGFANNDLFIVADSVSGGNCTLMQVSSITNFTATESQISHASGGANPFNAPALAGWPLHRSFSQIFHIGQLLQRTYSLNANALQSQDFPAAAGLAVASDIVQLQAQYGVAPGGAGAAGESVNCWTSASGAGCGAVNWANPAPAEFRRIKAIRIAVVARSALQERPDAGGTCSTTTVAPQVWNGAMTLDLSANADWRCFRYRVYETTVPLRNVIWGNVSA
jgi:type IV pilus assembly protein PilW